MTFTQGGSLYKGGWAIEVHWRGWHNWKKWGQDFGTDFRVGPVRLLHGTSPSGSESCPPFFSRRYGWFRSGCTILLYTPRNIKERGVSLHPGWCSCNGGHVPCGEP